MTKRRGYWIGSGIVLVLGIGLSLLLAFGSYTIQLSRHEIQEKIDVTLPKVTPNVTVEKATIDFVGNEIVIDTVMSGSKFGKPFSIEVRAIGTPRYEFLHGSFYFNPTNVEIVHFSGGGGGLGEAVKRAADRYITNPGIRALAQDIAPKVEGWVTSAAEASAVTFLKNAPVYRLKGDVKGIAAQAVLESVYIENDTLHIQLTVWRLTVWVAIFALCTLAALGMMMALVANPGIGTATILAGSISSFGE